MTPNQPPPRFAILRATIVYAFLVLLFLAAGWKPDPRTWGFHSLAFVTPSRWLVIAFVLCALFIPAVARQVGNAVAWVGARLVGSRWVPAGIAALGLAYFWFVRIEFPFLGDGIAWSNALRTDILFYNFEPLATVITRAVANAVDSNDPARGAGMVSILLGPAYIYGTARLCGALWTESHARGTAWMLLVFHPVVLFFCGYLESYPILIVVQVYYGWSLIESGRGRCPLILSILLGALAAATHVSGLAWLPALALVAHSRATSLQGAGAATSARRPGTAAHIARLVAPPFAAAVLAVLLVQLVGASPSSLLTALAGDLGLGGHSWSWLFSARHAVDFVNEVGLLLAPAFVLLAAGGLWRWSELSREWRVVLVLLAGPLVIAMGIEPRIGGARDWDLYTPLALPAILLSVEAWRRLPVPAAGVIGGRAVGLAVCMTLAWLAVGVSHERSARRLEVLQQPGGPFTNYARGYANETLGIYYRERDAVAARDAWKRATHANPNNPRYYNNLANEEARAGNQDGACVAFRRAFDLGMDKYFAIFNVAGCARLDENYSLADSLLTILVQRETARHEAWSERGFVRMRLGRSDEAMADLQEAVTRAPRDPETWYRIGLVHFEQNRMDEARKAWERTLQIQPRHPHALRRLQGSN